MTADRYDEDVPDCPYQGLDPFTKEDRAYFFGREIEQETIGATFLTSALTVLFGPSGVGKTSVLLAGVIPFAERQPAVLIVLFRTWQHEDFDVRLKKEIADEVLRQTSHRIDATKPLDACLAQASAATGRTIAVIFDQFEEYLLYHPAHSERGRRFDRELARAVNLDALDANFLISLREDALAGLDRFQPYIPDLLNNTIRLDHLDEEGAKRAIRNPVTRYNQVVRAKALQQAEWKVEEGLPERLIDDVRVDKRREDQRGKGRIVDDDPIKRIVTPFLQMVLVRLWQAERKRGSRELREVTLDALGGADTIVRNHVGEVMATLGEDERTITANMIEHLVTPSGSKIAHTARDLAAFASRSPEEVQTLLEKLGDQDRRLLRSTPAAGHGATRYEIFHDVLSDALLAWRAEYLVAKETTARTQERLIRQQEERRRLLRRLTLAAAIVALVLSVGVFIVVRDARAKAALAELERKVAASEQQQVAVLARAAEASGDVNLLQQLLAQYKKVGDVPGQVTTLIRLGDIAADNRKIADAQTRYQTALSLATDRSVRASILLRQARLLNSSPNRRPAVTRATEAVAAATGTPAEADVVAGAADIFVMAGEYDAAAEQFARAAGLYAGDDPQRRAEMLVNQAQALRDLADTDKALALLREAMDIFKKTGAGDRAATTSLAIDAREQARTLAAEQEAQRLRSQQELASVAAESAQQPAGKVCEAKRLNGIWTEVDRKTKKATTLSWTFNTSGEQNETLVVERRDGAVRGAFTLSGDRFRGVLEWTKGDRWENVAFMLPKLSASCRYIETNQAFTFVAARTIGLQPEVVELADKLIRAAAEQGLELRVYRGYVSDEEQAELYAQGRTKPGPKVTNAKGGTLHNRGLAFDVYIVRDGQPVLEPTKEEREKYGVIGESLGLTWGGRFKFPDYPHFHLEPRETER